MMFVSMFLMSDSRKLGMLGFELSRTCDSHEPEDLKVSYKPGPVNHAIADILTHTAVRTGNVEYYGVAGKPNFHDKVITNSASLPLPDDSGCHCRPMWRMLRSRLRSFDGRGESWLPHWECGAGTI